MKFEDIKNQFNKYLEDAMFEFYDFKIFEHHTFEDSGSFTNGERKEFIRSVIEPIVSEYFNSKGERSICDITESVVKKVLGSVLSKARSQAIDFTQKNLDLQRKKIEKDIEKKFKSVAKKGVVFTSAAALIAVSYSVWKKHKSKFCGSLTGVTKTNCLIKGCDLTISSLNRQLVKAKDSRDPERTREIIFREIDRWKERKKRLKELL